MAAGEYPGSTLYPAFSSNYSAANRPASNPINKIIVHVTQGSWAGAINWFQDPKAQVSAHYTIRSSDGAVGQSVREKDIGWHAGNWPYNQTSIGIEHEGYVSDPKWFTEAMYDSSARLSAYLCNKYLIPIDRDHIVGHVEVPYPNDHYDPGYNWNWYKYMDYVLYYATTV
jgi:N-acetyl-anhydromuramyl-L-alanine amidase AmpD